MNIAKLPLLGLASAGLVIASLAWSHPRDAQHTEHEVPISIADAEAKAAEVFARVDGDGDGEITRGEFAAAELPHDRGAPGHRRHGHGHPGMHGHGKHKRGMWTPGDEPAPAERRAEHEAEFFAALDSDGNGQLSPEEFDLDHRRAVRRTLMKSHVFDRLDTDANGVLSASEFPGRLARLKSLDADGNGEVSRDELRDGMRARQQQEG